MKPELVVGGYVFWEKLILLIRKKGEDKFVIPGGHIEYKEQAEKALVREIFEETGVRIKIDSFFRNIELIGEQHLFCIDYICSPTSDNPGLTLFSSDEKIKEVQWFEASKALKSKKIAQHIKQGLKQILKQRGL